MKKRIEDDHDIKLKDKIALCPAEIEVLYGITKGTLANWRAQKIGPSFYKIGKRKVAYKVSDFEKWFFNNPILTKECLSE